MVDLTPNQDAVMRYYAECVSSDWALPFSQVDAGLSLPSTKRAVRQLARLGYLELTSAFREDDGLLAGRGYMMTRKGLAWKLAYWASLPSQSEDGIAATQDERADMALPAGKTCGDCRHWRRCSALIQTLDPTGATCDFSPSRFSPKAGGELFNLSSNHPSGMSLLATILGN